jgi:hypothetical protein
MLLILKNNITFAMVDPFFLALESISLRYYEIPIEVLDDEDQLIQLKLLK